MTTIRVRTLGWLVALVAGLVLAGPAFAAAGCCDKGDGGGCFATDSASFCEDVCGGHHYQLGVCSGGTCQPTATSEDNAGVTAEAEGWPFPIPLCPWTRATASVLGDQAPLALLEKAEPRLTELRPAAEPASRDEPEPTAGR